jgi:hypothetical protein
MSYFSKYPEIIYDLTKPNSTVDNLFIAKDIIRRVKLKENLSTNVFSYDEYDIQEGERPDILAHQFFNDSELAWIILLTNEIHDVLEDWPRTENELRKMIAKKYGGSGPYALYGTGTSGMHLGEGYWYPIFLNEADAKSYNRYKQNGEGIAHIHTFAEFPNQTFYMPGNYGQGHAQSSYDGNTYKLWTINSGPNGIHHYERPQSSGDPTKMVRTSSEFYTQTTGIGVVQQFSSVAITNTVYEQQENEKKRRIRILRPTLVQEFIEEFTNLIGD